MSSKKTKSPLVYTRGALVRVVFYAAFRSSRFTAHLSANSASCLSSKANHDHSGLSLSASAARSSVVAILKTSSVVTFPSAYRPFLSALYVL